MDPISLFHLLFSHVKKDALSLVLTYEKLQHKQHAHEGLMLLSPCDWVRIVLHTYADFEMLLNIRH